MLPVELWNHIALRAGDVLSDDQHALLWRYIDLLLEANQRMNLTRIRSREEAAALHVGDALTVLPFLPKSAPRLADVGSGGGVPGIPLAIARPDAHVTLIESTQKKATFLREAIAALKLGNVAVDARRVEDVGQSPHARESFDVAVVRAVATFDWLAEWCLPLVKVGGAMLAMKGPKVHDELSDARRAIKLCGGGEPVLHPARLGTTGRLIVEVRKMARSDRSYPRPATHAKGKPLR